MLYIVFTYTLNPMTPNIELNRYCVSKILKETSTYLFNKCFEICWWIPLTMVKSLSLNSTLLQIKTPSLVFICSYASSVINKILNPLTVCEIRLQLRNPEQQAIFVCWGIRNKTNVLTKFTLQVYVCGIHWKFFVWNPLTF